MAAFTCFVGRYGFVPAEHVAYPELFPWDEGTGVEQLAALLAKWSDHAQALAKAASTWDDGGGGGGGGADSSRRREIARQLLTHEKKMAGQQQLVAIKKRLGELRLADA